MNLVNKMERMVNPASSASYATIEWEPSVKLYVKAAESEEEQESRILFVLPSFLLKLSPTSKFFIYLDKKTPHKTLVNGIKAALEFFKQKSFSAFQAVKAYVLTRH